MMEHITLKDLFIHFTTDTCSSGVTDTMHPSIFYCVSLAACRRLVGSTVTHMSRHGETENHFHTFTSGSLVKLTVKVGSVVKTAENPEETHNPFDISQPPPPPFRYIDRLHTCTCIISNRNYCRC